MTYSQAEVQGQRSVGAKDREYRVERTEAIALPDPLMRSGPILQLAKRVRYGRIFSNVMVMNNTRQGF